MHHEGTTDIGEYKSLLRSALRLHGKVEPGLDIERIVIKTTVANSPQYSMIHELFPQFNLVFNTRHPFMSMRSRMKLFHAFYGTTLYWRLYVYFLYMRHLPGFDYSKKHKELSRSYSRGFLMHSFPQVCGYTYGMSVACFLKNKGIYKAVILYEDLLDAPKETTRKILEAMEAPREFLSDAMEALE